MKCNLYREDTETRKEVCYITGEVCLFDGERTRCNDSRVSAIRQKNLLNRLTFFNEFRHSYDMGAVGWLQ